ncbi:MAG TPA: DNA methyltransferase, partial [Candidatus Limnocylindrales bacterium]|nr:DNA methyltransferase [Candidatus Limnocylindrales bacterium]
MSPARELTHRHKDRNAAFAASHIFWGDCVDVIPNLPDGGIQLFFFSPPYAEQRKGHYPSVSEKHYPAWMKEVMRKIRPKLTGNGVVGIVIRSHIRNGVVSPYVDDMKQALRDDEWCLCNEIIWYKSDAFAGGSIIGNRRA